MSLKSATNSFWKLLILFYLLNRESSCKQNKMFSCEDFVIFIGCDKDKFEHKIGEFVKDIIKEAQKSELYRYHWAVHCPLVEERETMPDQYFSHSIAISFTIN